MAEGTAAEPVEAPVEAPDEADFTAPDPDGKASDSESSDDGPPLDSYWASMLNVSGTADPLPPPKMLSKAELEERNRKDRGTGKGKSEWKGKGYGKYGIHPYGHMYLMPGMKGWKGKGGKRAAAARANDIGDFVAWAKDPAAEDGSRRARSRSPRRQTESEGLESFMSWAREERGVKEEPPPEGPGDGLNSFLEWAAAPAEPGSVKLAEEEHKSAPAVAGVAAKVEAAPLGGAADVEAPPSPVAVKTKEEVPPPAQATVEQSLIVPKELEEELRATEAAPGGSKREREHDSDEESGGGDG